jgi:hypothetical protein
VPWNPEKVLGSSQIVGSPDPTRPRLDKRPPSTTELLLGIPKKPQHFYEAAQTLSGMDKLSRTSRSTFRKAGKALAGMSVELANVRSANGGLRSQLDLKTLEASARGSLWTLIPSLLLRRPRRPRPRLRQLGRLKSSLMRHLNWLANKQVH